MYTKTENIFYTINYEHLFIKITDHPIISNCIQNKFLNYNDNTNSSCVYLLGPYLIKINRFKLFMTSRETHMKASTTDKK